MPGFTQEGLAELFGDGSLRRKIRLLSKNSIETEKTTAKTGLIAVYDGPFAMHGPQYAPYNEGLNPTIRRYVAKNLGLLICSRVNDETHDGQFSSADLRRHLAVHRAVPGITSGTLLTYRTHSKATQTHTSRLTLWFTRMSTAEAALPKRGSIPTTPYLSAEDVQAMDVACVGIPFDSTGIPLPLTRGSDLFADLAPLFPRSPQA